MGSVLKSFSTSKLNLLERVMLLSITSSFSLFKSWQVLICVAHNRISLNNLETFFTNKRKVV